MRKRQREIDFAQGRQAFIDGFATVLFHEVAALFLNVFRIAEGVSGRLHITADGGNRIFDQPVAKVFPVIIQGRDLSDHFFQAGKIRNIDRTVRLGADQLFIGAFLDGEKLLENR